MLLERPFAHSLETGGMRRVHLRGRENILKRVLVHYAALNLGLVLRQKFGQGTPRRLQDLSGAYFAAQMILVCELRQFGFESSMVIESAVTTVSENPTCATVC